VLRENAEEARRQHLTIEQLEAELAQARTALAEAVALANNYKAVAEPAKERFHDSNHYTPEIDKMFLHLLCAEVPRRRASTVVKIVAEFLGVKVPTRTRKVHGRRASDGSRTSADVELPWIPGNTHVKSLAAVAMHLNKLHVGEWLLEHFDSDETSTCYGADGAESQQQEFLGAILSRRINGVLDIKALDLSVLNSKAAEAQAERFNDVMAAMADAMQDVGWASTAEAQMLRRYRPDCTIQDRASTARKGGRWVRDGKETTPGTDGDEVNNDPTCAEHALVNILEEGRKAMDKVLRGMMQITDEQAATDAHKVKTMRTVVGWFSSPACALIYQVQVPPRGARGPSRAAPRGVPHTLVPAAPQPAGGSANGG